VITISVDTPTVDEAEDNAERKLLWWGRINDKVRPRSVTGLE